MNTYRNLTGWVIAILMVVAQPAVAQQRYDGTWNKTSSMVPSFISTDFGFKDSLFGLARFYTPDTIFAYVRWGIPGFPIHRPVVNRLINHILTHSNVWEGYVYGNPRFWS